MNTIKRHEYTQYFETAERFETKNNFIRFSCGTPKELSDLVREMHRECFYCFPNDWIYKIILQAFEELEDTHYEDMVIDTDLYYSDLYKWFGEPFAKHFVDLANEEGFCNQTDIYKQIESGQWMAKDMIYRMVDEFIKLNESEE